MIIFFLVSIILFIFAIVSFVSALLKKKSKKTALVFVISAVICFFVSFMLSPAEPTTEATSDSNSSETGDLSNDSTAGDNNTEEQTSAVSIPLSDLDPAAQELCVGIIDNYNSALEKIPDFNFSSVSHDSLSSSYELEYLNANSVKFTISLDENEKLSGITVEGLNSDPENQYNYCLVATYISDFKIVEIDQNLALLLVSPESDYQYWENDTASVTMMSQDGVPFYFSIFLK